MIETTSRNALAFAVLLTLASGFRLSAQVTQIVPFDRFLERTRNNTIAEARGPQARVRGKEALDKMRGHILRMYDGVQVKHSFVAGGSHFDCIPIEQQPAVRLLGLQSISEAPPQSLLTRPAAGTGPADEPPVPAMQLDSLRPVDDYGNDAACDASTIPMRRITLEEVAQFETLEGFFSKKTEAPADPAASPAAAAPSHKYSYVQQVVNNIGGNTVINLWSPFLNPAAGEIMTLSQAWYVGGSGAQLQTAEVGWQVLPSKYGTQSAVLFIYFTADNYSKTGCYNLDCGKFVQIANNGILGHPFTQYSTAGGEQREFSAQFYLYRGDWWLAINGTWIGYYPGSIYGGGQMSRFAQEIKFGTESVGSTVWPKEGSGYWPSSGWSYSAYQRDLFYFDTTGNAYWDQLTPMTPSPGCYSVSGPLSSPSEGWNVYFFAGGPGGTGC